MSVCIEFDSKAFSPILRFTVRDKSQRHSVLSRSSQQHLEIGI